MKLRFSTPGGGIAEKEQTACHYAHVVGGGLPGIESTPTVLASKSDDYTTAPQHLPSNIWFVLFIPEWPVF